jgi:hypothetical protein
VDLRVTLVDILHPRGWERLGQRPWIYAGFEGLVARGGGRN